MTTRFHRLIGTGLVLLLGTAHVHAASTHAIQVDSWFHPASASIESLKPDHIRKALDVDRLAVLQQQGPKQMGDHLVAEPIKVTKINHTFSQIIDNSCAIQPSIALSDILSVHVTMANLNRVIDWAMDQRLKPEDGDVVSMFGPDADNFQRKDDFCFYNIDNSTLTIPKNPVLDIKEYVTDNPVVTGNQVTREALICEGHQSDRTISFGMIQKMPEVTVTQRCSPTINIIEVAQEQTKRILPIGHLAVNQIIKIRVPIVEQIIV